MKSVWTWVALNAVLFAVLFLGVRILDNGPAPARSDFNAERALETLASLNPDNVPHPAGSEENARVRARIESALAVLGYRTETQKDLYCTSFWPGCTAIENIVAIKEGAAPGGDAIMLTSHYDSVPAAPGASDDLAGAAAMIEVARLIANEPLEHDVVFLFTDGEETGLRGAMAFAEKHPLMKRVKLTLNVEARGVSGPSAMFETSDGNRALISLYASAVSRPVANSLMFEVYRKMPNNTDMTIYKEAGAAGLNFAYSRGVALYHSSRDNVAHINPRSLAHHGDNLLTTLRRADSMQIETFKSDSDATYFDLFGATLIHWPSSLNVPASLLVIVLIGFFGVRTKAFNPGKALWAVAGVIFILVGLGVAGWLFSYPLGVWPGVHPLDHPYPWPGRIALTSASVFIALLAGAMFARRAGVNAFLTVSWLMIGGLALALALALPGGAYLALAPAAVFAAIAIVESFIKRGETPAIAAHAGFAIAAYMAVYHFMFFDVVFNFQVSYLKTPTFALAALASAPLAAWYLGERRGNAHVALIAVAAVSLITAAIGFFVPAHTEERPRSVNIAYQQTEDAAGSRTPQWRMYTYGPADKAYAENTGFPASMSEFHRFGSARASHAYFQAAKDHALPAPTLQVSEDLHANGVRTIRGALSASRNGYFFGVSFPADVSIESFSVEGTTLLESDAFKKKNGAIAYFNGVGDAPLSFTITTRDDAPVILNLFEVSSLPNDPAGTEIIEARPADAASIQFGDHAEVRKQIQL